MESQNRSYKIEIQPNPTGEVGNWSRDSIYNLNIEGSLKNPTYEVRIESSLRELLKHLPLVRLTLEIKLDEQ